MNLLAFIHTETGFYFLLSLFIMGAFSSLLFNRNDRLAHLCSSFFSFTASVWGLLFACSLLTYGEIPSEIRTSGLPLLQIVFHLDALAGFFIGVLSLVLFFVSVYAIDYVKQYYGHYSIGILGFFQHLFLLGMVGVFTSADALLFLIAWEVMSVASYFLVVFEHKNNNHIRAGFTYLVMTHIGTASLLLAFLLLFSVSGSFLFTDMQQSVHLLSPLLQGIIFLLFLSGLGVKAGMIPLHSWLPLAHPAAPSHISALMSGVMIKTAICMMIRLFLDVLYPLPLWCGVLLLLFGSASALLGVLYALTENDLKRLLACSSIENIGIILSGLGCAVIFSASGMPLLATLGLIAALFHTLNHALFKSLLFLSAGAVVHATGTRNIEAYGGLIKTMPLTAFFFLAGSMAISALPPLNGFYSEWLTFQALFQGIGNENPFVKWVFILATGALAFTGGLALACFVNAFGISFLARGRSQAARNAEETGRFSLAGMGGLAFLCLLFGLFSGKIAALLHTVIQQSVPFPENTETPLHTTTYHIATTDGFASVSGSTALLFLLLSFGIAFLLGRFISRRKTIITRGRTWDCGTDLNPRMEITSTGFTRSLVQIFRGVLQPTLQQDIEYHDAESRYLKNHSRKVSFKMHDIYHTYLYAPVNRFMLLLADYSGRVQGGLINTYILYIFSALLLLFLFVV